VAAWAVFDLVTPADYLLDATGFGVMLVLAGVQLILQALDWRDAGEGWQGIVIGALVAIAFGAAILAVLPLRSPELMYWLVVGFLAVDCPVFILAMARGPIYRFWGYQMGTIIGVACVILLVVHLAFDPGLVVTDTLIGALGIGYAIAMMVAALQVRQQVLTANDDL